MGIWSTVSIILLASFLLPTNSGPQPDSEEISYGVIRAGVSRKIIANPRAANAYLYMLPEHTRGDFLRRGGPLPATQWQTTCRAVSAAPAAPPPPAIPTPSPTLPAPGFPPPLFRPFQQLPVFTLTALPDFSNQTPSLGTVFRPGGAEPLPASGLFRLAGNDATGRFTGYTTVRAFKVAETRNYAIYSEGAGFTPSQFRAIANKLQSTRARRFNRHGPTTDIDANGKTMVVISARAQQLRAFGESWVDGGDLTGQNDLAEIVYAMWLPGAGVEYYQRNAMHEETHLATFAYNLLRFRPFQSPFIGSFYSWEFGDVGHPVSSINTASKQAAMRASFLSQPERSGPLWFPFDFGAYVYWVASDLFGEGFAEHFTPTLYDLTIDDPYNYTIPGLSESLLHAIVYATIVQDGEGVLALNGLQVSDWDVQPALKSAVRVNACNGQQSFRRHPTTAAILKITQPTEIEIVRPSRDLFVMLVE